MRDIFADCGDFCLWRVWLLRSVARADRCDLDCRFFAAIGIANIKTWGVSLCWISWKNGRGCNNLLQESDFGGVAFDSR